MWCEKTWTGYHIAFQKLDAEYMGTFNLAISNNDDDDDEDDGDNNNNATKRTIIKTWLHISSSFFLRCSGGEVGGKAFQLLFLILYFSAWCPRNIKNISWPVSSGSFKFAYVKNQFL